MKFEISNPSVENFDMDIQNPFSGTMYDLDLKSWNRKIWDLNFKSFRRKIWDEHLKSLSRKFEMKSSNPWLGKFGMNISNPKKETLRWTSQTLK